MSIRSSSSYLLALISIMLIYGCQEEPKKSIDSNTKLFSSIPVTESGLNFRNSVKESNQFNFINYVYVYNGGGVALGDINNDGLIDIYLTANQSSNKLFLNQGKMKFKDVTKEYGVDDSKGWTTGVTMIDINNDGWLDIYVCKSGSNTNPETRRNKLYINQGGKSFQEMAAAYGLNDPAHSTMAYFFDYDKDGDNDMYLVNHRSDWNNTIIYNPQVERTLDPYATDRLYRNDGKQFTDVSQQAGVHNKTWGQSAAIHDFNQDGWLDIYVCNDFIQGDQLWINNQDGSFTDKILETFDHTPFFSMGSDVADINNDGRSDLVIMDMISEDHKASKRLMAGMSTEQFFNLVNLGNHYQYMTNVMQLNRGNGVYSDVAFASGMATTDWSWAPLLADFDNDGLKDLFITNGIKRDVTDNDFKIALEKRAAQGPVNIEDIFEFLPSRKIANYAYKNMGHTKFEKITKDWGLDQNINSNGAAYGDLDNDGDLDLVVNNMEDYVSLYENNSGGNYIKVKLNGPGNNRSGIGAHVEINDGNTTQNQYHFLVRGYQSSVPDELHFGLGNDISNIDLKVVWPDGKTQSLDNVKINKKHTLNYSDAVIEQDNASSDPVLIVNNPEATSKLNFVHSERLYDDFATEILLPQKYSSLGPYASKADVNGDGTMDVFISGAAGSSSKLLLQNKDGSFTESSNAVWENDKKHEDLGSVFIDADQDGDLDLYVVSGGNEFPDGSPMYQDRFYTNSGKGRFKRSNNIPNIRTSGHKVIRGDFDADGDDDLFVGGRIVPGKYPMPANSSILRNDGGIFTDVTKEIAPELEGFGMVTDALFTDYDADNDLDLMIVGEWMGLQIFKNEGGKLSKNSFEDNSGIGWFFHINEGDFNNDGQKDYLLGNLGLNNKFGAKEDKIFHVFCSDFDDSGNLDIVLSKEKQGVFLPVRGRECSSQQMPFIKEKFETYKDFAEADLTGIYGKEKIDNALHYQANNFESIILLGDGQGGFTKQKLPHEAQFGPTLSSELMDINGDGNLDIMGAGNIYDAEVETVRYDASKAYVLYGDGNGAFKFNDNTGLILKGDVKQIAVFEYQDSKNLLVLKNNSKAELHQLNF